MLTLSHLFRARLPLALLLAFVAGTAPLSAGPDARDLEKRIDRIAISFEEVMQDPSSRIPDAILQAARGLIIFRQVEAGFIIGGKGGRAVALLRKDDGSWSGPAFLNAGEGSIGLQVGVQTLDAVFVLTNEEGVNLLRRTKFRIGVDAGAVAGPVGAQEEAKAGGDAPILVYSNNDGLFAGAAFEGGFLVPDDEANIIYAGAAGVTMEELLFEGRGNKTVASERLIERIESYLR